LEVDLLCLPVHSPLLGLVTLILLLVALVAIVSEVYLLLGVGVQLDLILLQFSNLLPIIAMQLFIKDSFM
jgi:hypothetical protein